MHDTTPKHGLKLYQDRVFMAPNFFIYYIMPLGKLQKIFKNFFYVFILDFGLMYFEYFGKISINMIDICVGIFSGNAHDP